MMQEAELKFSRAPLDEGLSFDDRLPLALAVCDQLPTVSERVRLNDRNVSLLKNHALEDFQRREVEGDLEGIASEIERLDQKITLVTELLCDLLAAEQKIPAPVPLRLSVAGLECTLPDALRLAVGDWTMVDLCLITMIPRPLKLLAKVVAIEEGKGVLSFAD